MKILVYGAGVLGCNLARNLFHAGKDVTLLARGNWAEEIRKNGSRINSPSAHRSAIFLWCEDKTIEIFLRFRCLDLNTRRGWKISIIWRHTLHDLCPLILT